jgi:hypothetical protein
MPSQQEFNSFERAEAASQAILPIQDVLDQVVQQLDSQSAQQDSRRDVSTQKHALMDLFALKNCTAIYVRPTHHSYDAQYNAEILSNLLLVFLYTWCAGPASYYNITEISQVQGKVVAVWAVLPALSKCLERVELFSTNHFHGKDYNSPQSLPEESRQALHVYEVAQNTWRQLQGHIKQQIQEIETRICLEEKAIYAIQKQKAKTDISLMAALTHKEREYGRQWILQRTKTWLQIGSIYRHGKHLNNKRSSSKEEYKLFEEHGCQLATVTYLIGPTSYQETPQDSLWKIVHGGCVDGQWIAIPSRVTDQLLSELRSWFLRRQALEPAKISEAVNLPKIEVMKQLLEKESLDTFSTKEIAQLLCAMKLDPRYSAIRKHIPWLP